MMNIIYILFQVSSLLLISLSCIEINKNEKKKPRQYAGNQLTDENGLPFIIPYKNVELSQSKRTYSEDKPPKKKFLDEIQKVLTKQDSFKFSKEYMNQIDEDIIKNKWIRSNNLENILENKKGLIIDLNSISSNISSQDKCKFITNLKMLDKICHENSIILFIIGEKPYYECFDKLKYFNNINYISPYHYNKSWYFSKPTKLPVGKFGKYPYNVSINTMIADISNQYGILTSSLAVVYFNESYNNINYECDHYFIN